MKKLLKVLSRFFIITVVATAIVLISAAFDFGTIWDALKTDGYKFGSHISLVLYRFALYLLPGTVLFLLGKIRGKSFTSIKSTFLESLNYQFAFYCLIKCAIVIFGLDYVANLKVFGTMDSFIVIFGFFATWMTKKTTKFGKTEILEKDMLNAGEEK